MRRIQLWFTGFLLPLDLLSVVVSVFVANQLRTSLDILPVDGQRISYPGYSFLWWYFPILVTFFSVNRLYILEETGQQLRQIFRVVTGTASAAMVQFMVILLGRTPFVAAHYAVWHTWANRISLLTILYFWLLTIVLVTVVRWVYRIILNRFLRRGIGSRRVLIIGTTPTAAELYRILMNNSALGYTIVGVVKTTTNSYELPIVGTLEEVEQLIARLQPDEILQADPDVTPQDVVNIIDLAGEAHAEFSFAPNLFEVRAANVRMGTIGPVPILELRRTPLDGWGKIIKRLIDILGAFFLTILFSPCILIAILIIKLQDGGPVFFSQERVSQGRSFRMYKFRSMAPHAEELEDALRHQGNERQDGPLFKMKRDPRVTPFGRFMRRSRIDELPQFFNVLRGDMSLVGPRPHLPKEVEKYQKHHRKVLTIKPGVTGIAQISGSSDLTFEEEVRLDTYYIENWSLLKDLEILVKTPYIIFKDKSGC